MFATASACSPPALSLFFYIYLPLFLKLCVSAIQSMPDLIFKEQIVDKLVCELQQYSKLFYKDRSQCGTAITGKRMLPLCTAKGTGCWMVRFSRLRRCVSFVDMLCLFACRLAPVHRWRLWDHPLQAQHPRRHLLM